MLRDNKTPSDFSAWGIKKKTAWEHYLWVRKGQGAFKKYLGKKQHDEETKTGSFLLHKAENNPSSSKASSSYVFSAFF